MIDIRPVINVIGILVALLGLTMAFPMAVDILRDNDHWVIFLRSGVITIVLGGLMYFLTPSAGEKGLSLQQTFLLTTGVWVALPVFGAIPFVAGATDASFTDAFFEAMSGLTTTGATVFSGLDDLPEGLLFWRAILQWLGGIGIIVVAMVFLPELRVGGMQIFRSEGFDTFGKILPRATEIASRVAWLYVGLTAACATLYLATGMNTFDAVSHAMSTVATGGFSTRDASFAAFSPGAEYVGAVFMCLAALPFVRYVQLLDGKPGPLFRDSQVTAFLLIVFFSVAALSMWLWSLQVDWEAGFRKALFNAVSIITGTGFASADYNTWGAFAVVLFFYAGLIGGCAGSTSCSVKVFRYQLLFSAIKSQIQSIYSPRGVFRPRYQGRLVGPDVLNSVLSFFVVFFLSLGLLAVGLSMTGLDLVTSVSGAAAALANIGPGLGDQIGPSGNYADINTTAKWLLSIGMLVGRLELLAVLALFTLQFWRA